MKILIIGEPFFGYAERIKKQLIRRGLEADLVFGYTPTSKDRFLKKIFKKEFNEKPYYQNLLNAKEAYNFILVINGKNLPDYFIHGIMQKNKKAEKVLYVWDDIKNLQQTNDFFSLFDRKLTYSKFDADENPGFQFQPFFFSHQFNVQQKDIGASFVGSLHSDRYKKLKYLQEKNPEAHFFFYLFSDLISYFKYATMVKLKDVKFKTLAYEEYIATLSRSKAVIELQHSTQRNITTRAIEVLGTQTKLITTSEGVKNYDFYNENNVFILNDNNTTEIQHWLKQDYQPYSEDLIRKYHINSWLDEILKRNT